MTNKLMLKEFKLYHDNIGKVEYVEHMGTDKKVCNAARVSLANDSKETEKVNKRDKKLTKFLWDNKHTSPFEHCILTAKFTVPLFVRSQHHRHRVWKFSEKSMRYTSKDIKFYLPTAFRTQAEKDLQASKADKLIDPVPSEYSRRPASNLVESHTMMGFSLYESLLKSGVCREQARMVLGQNLYTEYYGTCDLHNLFKFIILRDSPHAQWEIRRVAQALLKMLEGLYPVATSIFKESREK